MTDQASSKPQNVSHPMQLHLLANIQNLAASSHYREMQIGNVDESIRNAVKPIDPPEQPKLNGSANSSAATGMFGSAESDESTANVAAKKTIRKVQAIAACLAEFFTL